AASARRQRAHAHSMHDNAVVTERVAPPHPDRRWLASGCRSVKHLIPAGISPQHYTMNVASRSVMTQPYLDSLLGWCSAVSLFWSGSTRVACRLRLASRLA